MLRLSSVQLMVIGFVLLVIGVVLPFVMVLRIVEPTLLLNIIAYFASFIGVVIGMFGAISYSRIQRHDKD